MQKVKLNIVPKGVKKTTYLSQNDNGRVVRYELFNELIPYILDGSETITLKVVRPDGEEILANIENTFEGEAYIDVSFNDDMSAITGVGAGEIKIKDGETELGSHNFDINVEIDAYNGKDVVIETETGTLLSFNTEVEDNALEYESEIPYNAEGYTGLRVINTRTAPVYDKTPYLFRKTPSGYGNSCIEKLNGLSVAFNQLYKYNSGKQTSNGVSRTIVNGLITFEGESTEIGNAFNLAWTDFTFTNGHKVIVIKDFTLPSGDFIFDQYNITSNVDICNTIVNIRNGYLIPQLKITGVGHNYNGISGHLSVIDLTQMFGSTIADYIYSLETAQAGAGVAYFKNLFGADYYPYNAGELMSVKTSARKTIGFNQWDEQWEYINSRVTSKNYIPVVPNTVYYFGNIKLYDVDMFDISKNSLGNPAYTGVTGGFLFTTASNCAFIKFSVANSYGTTYKGDICINISDPERNGQYEPYNAVTYPLDPDLELRGIPKLDANNKLYGDGDIYESSGGVTRRYGIVDLGSLNWTNFISMSKMVYISFPQAKTPENADIKANIICSSYITISRTEVGYSEPYTVVGIGIDPNGNLFVTNPSSNWTSKEDAKTALNGVYMAFELATPTSESADPYTDPQEARITEEFIDTREIPIPVAQDTIYGTDIEYQDIDFDTTIFGGEIDAVNGVLSSEYNSDGSVKPTPEIIDITPTPIPVKAGDNKIFNTANGNQTIRYYNQVEE